MHLYEQGRRRHLCPVCGRNVRRVHRTEDDMESRFAESMARYRCVSAACGWDDLLPTQSLPRSASPTPASRLDPARLKSSGRRLLRAWPLLLAGLATAVVVSHSVTSGAARGDARNTLPLKHGEHHDGVEMTPDHPLLKAVSDDTPATAGLQRLTLKQGCAWGLPGRNPYRGSVEQALVTAKLPAEVIQRISAKVNAGQLDDRLEISNAGIRTERDEREFEPRNVAMTYGNTLCVNTRVNFQRGHVERASLYEAADKKGNLYSVMVPDVCGNVSVLGARMERNRKRVPLAVLAVTAHGAPALMRMVSGAAEAEVHTVPEPGTLACVLGALAVWAGIHRHQRRRRLDRA
jgi:hypothetical protein